MGPPLAYVKQICNVVKCYQHPCGSEVLSSGDFKRTVEFLIDTLFKQICNVVNCYQHPCGSEVISSGDFKRTVEFHIDTLFKTGCHFPLGTNMYMSHLNACAMSVVQ